MEVDFVALKNAKPHYYQVTMNLAEPAVIERETRSLLAIQDNFPKTTPCASFIGKKRKRACLGY